jgi:hypothetical protein
MKRVEAARDVGVGWGGGRMVRKLREQKEIPGSRRGCRLAHSSGPVRSVDPAIP